MTACSKRYIPLLLLIHIFVCVSGKMGLAADASAGKIATCGGYTYTLPEGFYELSLHRQFDENISINALINRPSPLASSVACITIEDDTRSDFIVEKVRSFITGSEMQKHPMRGYPKRYEAELPETVRLYTFYGLYHSKKERDFGLYLVELKTSGSECNALLYVTDNTYSKIQEDDPRTWEQKAVDENIPKKERAMRLIHSVRRTYE